MRALPREGEEQVHAGNGSDALDSIRSWLASGAQLVDRRRRFGRHGRTRKLLVVDPAARTNGSDGWHSTTSALQRHTVGGALSELEPQHRRVITLAYLEGQSNRQIAAALGVSVTTARRRLWKALERLEMFVSAAGAWLAALLVGFSVYVLSRLARLTDSADTMQRVAATVAVGALAAAAVGVVTVIPSYGSPSREAPKVIAPMVPFGSQIAGPEIGNTPLDDVVAAANSESSRDMKQHRTNSDQSGDAAPGGGTSNSSNGCHGNVTGAPPQVPVMNHGHVGPPVDPPKGGCKNL